MRFAVGFEGYLDHQLKNDTRYVRVLARIVGIDSDGAKYDKLLQYHVCTKEDYDKFYPPNKYSRSIYRKYYEGERHLYCLDWEKLGDELSIWGQQVDEKNY